MSAAIGPGDWVECVDRNSTWGGLDGGCDRLCIGAIYRVVEVLGPSWDVGLLLAEVQSDHFSGAFNADHFRPVYRPKEELIESLKAPPVRVGEPA